MTEQEWMECVDPTPMLEFLGRGASDRRKRLFALACCRDVLSRIDTLHRKDACDYLKAIATAERHADGEASDSELGDVIRLVNRLRGRRNDLNRGVYDAIRFRRGEEYQLAGEVVRKIADAVAKTVAPNPSPSACVYFVGDEIVREFPPPNKDRLIWHSMVAVQRQWSCFLLRDIVGNPFRHITLDPKWRTDDVTALAQGMYESRDFSDMPALATAFRDAGYDNEDILNHCKFKEPHVRGCWVVDAVLDKQ